MSHGEYKEVRGRNFAFVQKLELLPPDWREILADKLLPIAYIVHDKDVKVDDATGEVVPVEPHVHVFVYFNGKRTASGVVAMFQEFGIAYAERIECKNAYLAYMLHLRQEDKHTYSYEELVIINGLKVNFADLSDVDFGDVMNFARERGIHRFSQLMDAAYQYDPPIFRYIQGHYGLVCAYYSDAREGMQE